MFGANNLISRRGSHGLGGWNVSGNVNNGEIIVTLFADKEKIKLDEVKKFAKYRAMRLEHASELVGYQAICYISSGKESVSQAVFEIEKIAMEAFKA